MTIFSWDEPIDSDLLLAATRSLEKILGKVITDAFILELENRGMIFNNGSAYPLQKVREAAVSIFGEDGGYLLAYFLRKYMEDENKSG